MAIMCNNVNVVYALKQKFSEENNHYLRLKRRHNYDITPALLWMGLKIVTTKPRVIKIE